MSLRCCGCLIVAVLGVPGPLTAADSDQAPPPAMAIIAGQVVDADTGRTVPETIVTLSMTPAAGAPPVSPAARETGSRKVITDSRGRFVFAGLAKGRYSLTTTKPGYVAGVYGKLVPRGAGTAIDLGEAERLVNLRILTWKHAVITGRVVDEAGEPMAGVEVSALRRTSNAGRGGYGAGTTTITDDRGMYRLASLEPGTYLVAVISKAVTVPAALLEAYFRTTGSERAELQSAIFGVTNAISSPGSPSNHQVGNQILVIGQRAATPPMPTEDGRLSVYPTTYHPQTVRPADAEAVAVRGGESKAGIDFALRPVSGVRVSGTLESPAGPVGNTAVHLVVPGSTSLVTDAASTVAGAVADAAGAFSFLGVPPGQYALRVIKVPVAEPRQSPGAVVVQTPAGTASRGIGTNPDIVAARPTYWAEQAVTVGDRNVDNVRVPMRTGFRIAGKIVFEPGGPTIPVQRLYPSVEATEQWRTSPSEAFPAADGSFTLPDLPGGLYRITLPLPAGWIVKSVVVDGRELPDLPFELKDDLTDVVITVSNRVARLSGAIRDAKGGPDATAAVVLFPADRRQWVNFSAYARGLKDVRSLRDGTYALPDLVAGEYFVIAVAQSAIDWSDPGLLERLSKLAVRVTLAEAEQRVLDLRTAVVR
jgi:protocatechuate 3,4-dioxygenase beta subunit